MLGEDFDAAKAKHGRGNIDFGRRGDDELLSSDGEEQGAEDASMEEGQFSDVLNTSGNTLIERSPADAVLAENMMNEMLTRGFGCFRISDSDQSAPNGGLITFLDKSLKLDTAESAEQVVKMINLAKTMKALELRGNTLGIAAGNVIAKALERHPELERCLWSGLLTGRLKNEIPPILEALE